MVLHGSSRLDLLPDSFMQSIRLGCAPLSLQTLSCAIRPLCSASLAARNSRQPLLTLQACETHLQQLLKQLSPGPASPAPPGTPGVSPGAGGARGSSARASAYQDAAPGLTSAPEGGNGAPRSPRGSEDPPLELPPYKVYAPDHRIIAIGDLHGDFEVAKASLQLGGVISTSQGDAYGEDVHWTGGSTLVVQVGDILDRGEDEIAILSLLRHLDRQAREAGGRVFQINGNHETLNVANEFRYVTEGGFWECELFTEYCVEECGGNWSAAFRDWWRVSQEVKRRRRPHTGWTTWNPLQLRRLVKARSDLFHVGGPLAKELSRHGVALMINNTLFAHGGVLPHHVDYGLDKMNGKVSRWMRGDLLPSGEPVPMPFIATRGADSIVWSRLYSQEAYATPEDKFMACSVLATSLDSVGAVRLVVGHTPQMGGANSSCNGRVWRIDVGMSSGMMGAAPQVLEIEGDDARVLGKDNQGAWEKAAAPVL